MKLRQFYEPRIAGDTLMLSNRLSSTARWTADAVPSFCGAGKSVQELHATSKACARRAANEDRHRATA